MYNLTHRQVKQCSTGHQQKVDKTRFSEEIFQETMMLGKESPGKYHAGSHAQGLAR